MVLYQSRLAVLGGTVLIPRDQHTAVCQHEHVVGENQTQETDVSLGLGP
jgi:hypothetical protein